MLEIIKYDIVGEHGTVHVDTPGMTFNDQKELKAFRKKILEEYPEHEIHFTFTDKNMKELFNSNLISARITEIRETPRNYYIGVDAYSDENESAYCLGYKETDTFVVLLAKTEKNKDSFIEEVNNLMKYFNAVKIETGGKGKEGN